MHSIPFFRRAVLLFLFTAGCTAQQPGPAQQDSSSSQPAKPPAALRILTENSGDANYINNSGKLTGHSVELVREMLRRLKLDIPIQVYPWVRAYRMLQTGPGVILFSTARTPLRENQFKWVGPLYVNSYHLFRRAAVNTHIRTLDDAKKAAAIGCVRSDVREQMLIRAGFTNLAPTYGAGANTSNLKKLLAGRIDLWVSSVNVVESLCRELKLPREKIVKAVKLADAYIYIAFSRDIPDTTVARWQTTLDTMKQDGSYRRIMEQFPTGRRSMTFTGPAPALTR